MIEVAVILSGMVGRWPGFFIIPLLLVANAVVEFCEEREAGIEALKAKLAIKARVKVMGSGSPRLRVSSCLAMSYACACFILVYIALASRRSLNWIRADAVINAITVPETLSATLQVFTNRHSVLICEVPAGRFC